MYSINHYVLLFLIVFISYSQESDNVTGKKFTIESKILGEKRDIQIYFPDSYNTSKKDYSVLYILDGQRYTCLG